MSCTLERGAERSTSYGVLRFGSFDRVVIDDELRRLEHGMDGAWLQEDIRCRGGSLGLVEPNGNQASRRSSQHAARSQ